MELVILVLGLSTPGASRLRVVGQDDSILIYSLFTGGATTTGLVVRNDGNVGIGTISPSAKFEVIGGVGLFGGIPTATGVTGGSLLINPSSSSSNS